MSMPFITTPRNGVPGDLNLLPPAIGLTHLVTSIEPAVVFTSLASLSVPAFSDGCTVEIVDDRQAAYRISYPTGRGTEVSEPQLRLPFEQTPSTTGTCFSGSIAFSWSDRAPGAAEATIAQLMVDRATAAIEHERLAEALRTVTFEAVNLQAALANSRKIGTAMGILMFSEKITSDVAFDQLRRLSQCLHRKLHDIAEDVVLTGGLDQR